MCTLDMDISHTDEVGSSVRKDLGNLPPQPHLSIVMLIGKVS